MKEKPKNIKYGDQLGDLVFEGYFEHITINKSREIDTKIIKKDLKNIF